MNAFQGNAFQVNEDQIDRRGLADTVEGLKEQRAHVVETLDAITAAKADGIDQGDALERATDFLGKIDRELERLDGSN